MLFVLYCYNLKRTYLMACCQIIHPPISHSLKNINKSRATRLTRQYNAPFPASRFFHSLVEYLIEQERYKEKKRKSMVKFSLSEYLDKDEEIDEVLGLDLKLSPSAMAFYPYPFMPIFESTTSFSNLSSSNEPRDYKRMKRTASTSDFNDLSKTLSRNSNHMSRSSSTSSVSSLSKPHFRDHILTFTQRYLATEAMEEAPEVINNKEEIAEDGVKLVNLLMASAEAVACRDRSHASMLLSELRSSALVFGSSFQRVASCFVQGLTDRMAFAQPVGTLGIVSPIMNIMDDPSEKMEEAFELVYDICPQIRFGHFAANSSILEAFEGESFAHVVDLGMTHGLSHGHQWRGLIRALAERHICLTRRLRITVVGLAKDRFRMIGDELKAYADEMGITLEFSIVEKTLDNLKIDDIEVVDGEVLVVNSIFQLHCVVKESRIALSSVLQMIHDLNPKITVMVEQDSSHNGPFFLGRFMEALHYYSAIFDSLDAMLPKYDTRRAKIEQFYFGEEIKNIVSCEGPARVERHEKMEQWRRRLSRAGFQVAPLRMVAPARKWLSENGVSEGYTVTEEKGCLVLGWQSKPIIAVSCWKC